MAGKHPLRGGVRAFASHKTPEGRQYGSYTRGLLARLGQLPPGCGPVLKQAGRLAVEIDAMERDYDRLMARRRLTEARRLRRQLTGARMLLLRTEERLESIAAQAEPAAFSHLRAVRRG